MYGLLSGTHLSLILALAAAERFKPVIEKGKQSCSVRRYTVLLLLSRKRFGTLGGKPLCIWYHISSRCHR